MANEVSAASAAQDANNNNARDKRGWRRNGRSSETSGTGSTTGSTTATYTRRKKALLLSLRATITPLPVPSSVHTLVSTFVPDARACNLTSALLLPLFFEQEVKLSFLSNGIRGEKEERKRGDRFLRFLEEKIIYSKIDCHYVEWCDNFE